jgi:hypothetical protein
MPLHLVRQQRRVVGQCQLAARRLLPVVHLLLRAVRLLARPAHPQSSLQERRSLRPHLQ